MTVRILFMDDEPVLRRLVPRMLESLGYETDTASCGEEAVERYRQAAAAGAPYAAVILDLTIPGGMDGRQTMRKLRELDPGVKAIVSSGYADGEDDQPSFREDGFQAVMAKPYDVCILGATLQELLGSA